MKSDEAIEQIEFLKKLTAKTQLKAAYGYPYYILWGIVVIIGYISKYIIPHKFINYHWYLLCIIGSIITGIILLKLRKKYNYTLLLKRIALQCGILIISDVLIFGLFIHYKVYEILNSYWPFQFGIIYIIASIHMSRDIAYIGFWMIITSIISLFLPASFQDIWLAFTCGGGLLFTGILFRNQIKKMEEKITE